MALKKMGNFPFINIVDLTAGVWAQLGRASELSCNPENTRFWFCNENGDAVLVTRLLIRVCGGEKSTCSKQTVIKSRSGVTCSCPSVRDRKAHVGTHRTVMKSLQSVPCWMAPQVELLTGPNGPKNGRLKQNPDCEAARGKQFGAQHFVTDG